MAKDDVIQMQGEIVENLPNATFGSSWKMVMLFWVIFPERCACTTSGFCRVIR